MRLRPLNGLSAINGIHALTKILSDLAAVSKTALEHTVALL